jgi:hypothetical protein
MSADRIRVIQRQAQDGMRRPECLPADIHIQGQLWHPMRRLGKSNNYFILLIDKAK